MKAYHKSKSYIKHATIAVSDLDDSENFYNSVIQLDTLHKDEESIILGNNENPLITLIKSNGEHPIQEGLYHIAFLVKSETQLANWLYSNLHYKNFIGASHHGVSKAIYLQDPDGNGIEVYADTDDSKWVHSDQGIEMGTYPLNINELLSKRNEDNDFELLIGHLHLQTKDVDIAAEFYQNLLFEVTFDLKSAMFLSFNQYHHHIAFNEWNKDNMDEHQLETTDLQAYEIWYDDINKFKEVKSNLETNNIQYHQDGDFILLKDPLGIEIKLTY